MNLDPQKLLSKRIGLRSAALLPIFALYVSFTFVLLFQAVIPSFENGTTSWTFATDSTVYTDFANSLREGRNDPWVIASLSFFPNTLWTPVFIAFILNSEIQVMLLNYAVFIISILLLNRAFSISWIALVFLLLLNPTTTTSLLCVNKEILDLLSVSLFLYARKKRHLALLLVALGLSLLNRWEICGIMVVFLICESRLNFWRARRWLTLSLLVLSLNFVMPLWWGPKLAHHFEEAESAGLIKVLDVMQLHYLYPLVVIPKIAQDLFGQLLNSQVWTAPSSWLFINFFNNVAYAILIFLTVMKRRFTLQSDFIYLSALGAVIVAQALVVQPRYFYFAYVLLCVQAAHKGSGIASGDFSFEARQAHKHA